ncbi:MAG: DUF5317 family protein [bacterium]|nr:DUF5317 family protein [bacterium]
MLFRDRALRIVTILFLLGFGMNMLAIIANGGKMPVAVVDSQVEYYSAAFNKGRHIRATSETPFVWLGDWILVEQSEDFVVKKIPNEILPIFLYLNELGPIPIKATRIMSVGDYFIVISFFIFLPLLIIDYGISFLFSWMRTVIKKMRGKNIS